MRVIIFIVICIIRIQFIRSDGSDEENSSDSGTSTTSNDTTTSTVSTTSTASTTTPTQPPIKDVDMLNMSSVILENELPDFLEAHRNTLSVNNNSSASYGNNNTYFSIQTGFPEDKSIAAKQEYVEFKCPVETHNGSMDNGRTPDEPRVMWAIYDDFDDIEIITELHDHNYTNTYVIKNPTDDDNGGYMCVMYTYSDAKIRDAKVANLTVEKIPELLQGPSNTESQTSTIIIVSSIVVGFLLLGTCLVVRQRRNAAFPATIKRVIIERDGDSTDILKCPIVRIECREFRCKRGYAENLEYELPIDDEWEFPRDKLKLTDTVLGEGEFGQVVQASAYGIVQPLVWTTVAVKTLKASHIDEDMASIIAEVEIMKMIGEHKHVLKLLGVSCKGNPFLMIMEYALHGNLKNFLKQCSSDLNYPIETDKGFVIDIKVLINFARQIAEGMDYLASLKCVHRDLAARNVLVCEDYVMKVADFGLARDIHYSEYYRNSTKGRLPVKWMAPEALLQRVYTSKSDSWSYGILLWEMMTLGGIPYPSVPCCEELHQILLKGYRMECPPNCPPKIYAMMRECWMYNPNDRPDFQKIMQDLDEILAENDGLDGMPFSGLSVHSSIDNLDTSSDEDDDGNCGDSKKSQYPLLKERAAQLAKYPSQEGNVSEKTASITKNPKVRHSFAISEANEYTVDLEFGCPDKQKSG
ncbi:fibroblast growth factor receptor homolog 1-like [Planococcus citri]|uniref:fibroblast growth factor receptor homolog 1-like n=1 Tax=Planococcus citri TaxID=170843 RepID=UPI0031F90BC2